MFVHIDAAFSAKLALRQWSITAQVHFPWNSFSAYFHFPVLGKISVLPILFLLKIHSLWPSGLEPTATPPAADFHTPSAFGVSKIHLHDCSLSPKNPGGFLPYLVSHSTVCLSCLTFSATVIPAMAVPSVPIRLVWACSLSQPGLPSLQGTGLVLGPRRPWFMQQISHFQHCPGTLRRLFLILSSSQPKTHFVNQCSFSKLEPLWSRLKMCPHCKWLLFPITYASLSHHAICSLHAGLQELFAPNHWQPLSKLKPSA